MTWPFGALRPLGYRVILVDPPWRFFNWSAKGEKKNPNQHYACMTIEELEALPVGQLAAGDCVLVMWATWPLLPRAIALMARWGFTYKSGGSWAKQSSTGEKWAIGPGYIYRVASEPWILGTIGKPRRISKAIRNLIVAPVREHSRKPEQMRDDLEKLFDGPFCELFSRHSRVGWEAWGDEAGKFDAG
jgi:N6-adenosine-specific RNA methylase IME4